ncbi:hypothetical protein ACMFMF_010242 [Clarireedia jacksonii]
MIVSIFGTIELLGVDLKGDFSYTLVKTNRVPANQGSPFYLDAGPFYDLCCKELCPSGSYSARARTCPIIRNQTRRQCAQRPGGKLADDQVELGKTDEPAR